MKSRSRSNAFPCSPYGISRHKSEHLDADLGHTTIGNPQAPRGTKRQVEDTVANPWSRSVITTTTDLLVARSVTRTLVPNGRLRCAAVGKFRLNDEPLAVFPV